MEHNDQSAARQLRGFELDIPPPLLRELKKSLGAESLRAVLLLMSSPLEGNGPRVRQTKRQEKEMWKRLKVLYGRREASDMKRFVKTNWAGVRRVETIESRLSL